MAYFVLVQLIISFALGQTLRADKITTESMLGEVDLAGYSERYYPLIKKDPYRGKISFYDDHFWKYFLNRYGFSQEDEMSNFLKLELTSSSTCSNAQLSKHFDEIRYSFRLITLSYLLESQWHMDMVSKSFKMNRGCSFTSSEWVKKCRPKSVEMKKFVSNMKKHVPKYNENLPTSLKKSSWFAGLKEKKFTFISHYRINQLCQGECSESDIEEKFQKACEESESLMTLICSEEDSLYGLSGQRDAYELITGSNIINTYNKQGEASGCLRRFAEVMSHKEVKYPDLKVLFPPTKAHLLEMHKERFLQGRAFFYGSGKEFDERGMQNLYVLEQPLKIEPLPKEAEQPITAEPKVPTPVKPVAKVPVSEPKPILKAKPIVEVPHSKSAFLQAAEARELQNLDMAEVDMLKLKYDYVFSLSQINKLATELVSFMSRDALLEMANFDKLGTKEGPVPLLFIKYMIDMQEHTGLFNLVNVLGDKFWVSNEIDLTYSRRPEYISLINNEATSNQWQIFVLKAR